MTAFRSKEMKAKYAAFQAAGGLSGACPLCTTEALKTFTYLKIIPNRFPYDGVAKQHDMVVPLRHATWAQLTEAERSELEAIKETYISDTYEYIIEAAQKIKSIPTHFHLHLVVSSG
jgi:hypothetical protein